MLPADDDDMVQGYRDGFADERDDFPASLANRGASYRHGWMNGRDDRLQRPRATVAVLKEQAREAHEADRWPI
jgi:hypothetical protein